MNLTVIRLKPNPAGRDRQANGHPTPSQLAGEWVDFRNDERTSVDALLDKAIATTLLDQISIETPDLARHLLVLVQEMGLPATRSALDRRVRRTVAF